MIGQRYQGERPARAVNLGRHIVVGDGMRHRKGQRLLSVTRCFHSNTCRFAQARSAPVRGNGQLCAHRGAIAKRDAGFGGAGEERGGRGARAKFHIRQFRDARQKLAPQQPIGQVPSEGQIGQISRVEFARQARFGIHAARIDNAHDLQFGGMRGKAGPNARTVQKRLRGLQKCRCAQIRSGPVACRDGRRRIDAEHRKPCLPKDAGRRQTRDAAAGNQDINVGSMHGFGLLNRNLVRNAGQFHARSAAPDVARGCAGLPRPPALAAARGGAFCPPKAALPSR